MHSRLMDSLAIDWHNKVLLNRIKNAKPKVNTNAKTMERTVNNGRWRQLTRQQMEIEQKNQALAQKLAEIYGRTSQH